MDDKAISARYLWRLFTLEEEYAKKELDGMYYPRDGRDVLDPVVSRHVFGKGAGFAYPGDKKFAVCLTHDIDDLYPPLSHKFLSTVYDVKSLRGTDLKDLWFPVWGGNNRSPYRNFRRIMDIEESYGARSSFYFMATDDDIRRFRYNVEELESDIGMISDRGWEVGLHGGYYAFDSLDEIRKEKQRLDNILGKPSVGYRNHYLRFKLPDTWSHLCAAGFKYDATIGINNAPGFMNGTCHPYYPYDLNNKRWLDILEIPMAIMDVGLFWQKKSPSEALDIAKRVIDRVAECGGVATLLWHNTSFCCPFRPDWEKVYCKILEYSRDRGAWMASGADVWEWAKNSKDAGRWERGLAEKTSILYA
jgi:peptidoglycan/xylan/chitin deacetylase (PgdA/CDA1 family)